MSVIRKVAEKFGVKDSRLTDVILLAAGSGSRFSDGGVKKQLYPILGRTPVERCLDVFSSCSHINRIIIVCDGGSIAECRGYLERYEKVSCVTEGGATRQESAFIGMTKLSEEAKLVAVHDAARCLVTEDIIERVIVAAAQTGAALAAERAVDTVKLSDLSETVKSTPDRRDVWLAKTPQIFLREIYEASAHMAKRNGTSVTDDCSMVEALGFKVKLVDCGHENIKITYKSDVYLAEAILKSREDREE